MSTLNVSGITSPSVLTIDRVSAMNGGQLAGHRNKIINGRMDISQRGATFSPVSGAYTLDRWQCSYNSTAGFTVSQQFDAPLTEFQTSLRLAVTVADTSITTAKFAFIRQRVEGMNARELLGRTFTLSFWVRSSKTGTHCVAFQNNGPDRSYIGEYTVNAANTWEYKSITVTGGLVSAGSWNWIGGVGLSISWALMQGNAQHATAGSWQVGNFLSSPAQVNCFDTVGNVFAITGVQLEVGAVASAFEHRHIGAELMLCNRYYYRRTPTSMHVSGDVFSMLGNIQFPVTMRAVPTISHSLITANYVGTAPTGLQWNIQKAGIQYVAAQGGVNMQSGAQSVSPDNCTVIWHANGVQLFSVGTGNLLTTGETAFFEASAEL
jgi:hypothetical protein